MTPSTKKLPEDVVEEKNIHVSLPMSHLASPETSRYFQQTKTPLVETKIDFEIENTASLSNSPGFSRINSKSLYSGSRPQNPQPSLSKKIANNPFLRQMKQINEIGDNWLTVYHPLGGFNFEEYGNLKMCDDCGPNRYFKELTNYPMD